MIFKTTLSLFNTDLNKLQRLAWVLIAIYLPFNALAIPTKVKSKVSQNTKKLAVFNNQSKLRAKNNAGGFMTIEADASCDFDSATNSIQVAIDSGTPEIGVASNCTCESVLCKQAFN